jgi:hypothetical protein
LRAWGEGWVGWSSFHLATAVLRRERVDPIAPLADVAGSWFLCFAHAADPSKQN